MHYNTKLVLATWRQLGLPAAVAEHGFCAERKWRFDFAFPKERVAIEVQGGIFGTGRKCRTCGQRKAGRHTRGTALVDEYEKLRAAAMLGWRVLPCLPRQIYTRELAEEILTALNFRQNDKI